MDNHYKFQYRGGKLDPYRILHVYGITHPAQQHAIKKLLRAGKSVKPLIQDIDEVILSLQRWREMIVEDVEDANFLAREIKCSPHGKVRCRDCSHPNGD